MQKVRKAALSLVLTLTMLVSIVSAFGAASAASANTMLVGVGKANITGPINRISTGYNSLGDLMSGILTRLNSRAFIISDGKDSVVYVAAEVVHMTESIKPAVIQELHARGLDQYNEDNVMIAATHCHSSSSNVSWSALYDLMNGVPGYDDDSYQTIVQGIADSIEEADKDLAPGSATLYYGDTDIDVYCRSIDAAKWNVNYDESLYDSDYQAALEYCSKEMQLVSFKHGDTDIGMLSFFGSHGTSNSIDNDLIAADHKGYACWYVEQKMGGDYVAANAQSPSGDASPNAVQEEDYQANFERPADIDEDLDVIENQIVAGQQEADAMLSLVKGGAGITEIELTPDVQYNYTTVDFSDIDVDEEYIGEYHMPYDDVENAATSAPCIGAGIIAGDEEGAPVDNASEGSVRRDYQLNEDGSVSVTEYDFSTIDLSGLEKLFPYLWDPAMALLNSYQFDDEQMEKVVCLNVTNFMEPVQPLQIIRIGEFAICGTSFEINTEAGNRTVDVISDTLSDIGVEKVVLSTLTNSYAQYVTTREEYAAQHYEGSTCLFGPWSNAALTQEFDKIATDMVNGTASDPGPGMPQSEPTILIETPASLISPTADIGNVGELTADVEDTYENDEWVTASFTGANPRHATKAALADDDAYPEDYTYLEVQKKVGDKWVTVRDDDDPYTTFRFDTYSVDRTATVSWLLRDVETGTYRFAYNYITMDASGDYTYGTSYSSEFYVDGVDAATDVTPTDTAKTEEAVKEDTATEEKTSDAADTNDSTPVIATAVGAVVAAAGAFAVAKLRKKAE